MLEKYCICSSSADHSHTWGEGGRRERKRERDEMLDVQDGLENAEGHATSLLMHTG